MGIHNGSGVITPNDYNNKATSDVDNMGETDLATPTDDGTDNELLYEGNIGNNGQQYIAQVQTPGYIPGSITPQQSFIVDQDDQKESIDKMNCIEEEMYGYMNYGNKTK